MCDIKIKVIPAHIVYCREYEIKDYNDFFDEATGANILADLEELMHSGKIRMSMFPKCLMTTTILHIARAKYRDRI